MPDKDHIPCHVAIIMDGNGRWAKQRGLPRSFGHRQGVKKVKEIIKSAADLGIKVITFFAFSSENWNRPKKEVDTLMRLLNNFLDKEIRILEKNNICFKFIGKDNLLPESVLAKIKQAEKKTADNSGLTVALAFNYGARQEIVDAVKKFTRAVISQEADVESLDIQEFSKYLYTAGLPDPDLLIRTSNEMRLSNFLLWQLSYAEFYFSKKYWPDFGAKDFLEAIKEYQRRERRFGGINA